SSSKSGNKISSIVYGVIIMIIASIIWFYTGTALIFLVYLINIIILLSGIARFNNSLTNKQLSRVGKGFKFLSGVILIILALAIFLITLENPSTSTELLLFLITIGLLVIGIARIGSGAVNKKFIMWYRVILIIIGSTTIILNLIPILIQPINETLNIYLISISLFINGFARFLYGLTGKERIK
ncbi:MAG: DUF308 domain-containing protein, partial [Candidatus Lokiarchaeota archaeon]|nr:DUF308 domain-containing protein [Candidatus Lokiarchaeota archaeon]